MGSLILVVENTPIMARMYRSLLNSLGVPSERIQICETGLEALQAYDLYLTQNTPPSLILLELMLDDAKGPDIIRGLRGIEAQCSAEPAMIITTCVEKNGQLIADALNAGADAFFVKVLNKANLFCQVFTAYNNMGKVCPLEDTF